MPGPGCWINVNDTVSMSSNSVMCTDKTSHVDDDSCDIASFTTVCLLSVCCFLVLSLTVRYVYKLCNDANPLSSIPGPLSLPLIGSVLSIGKIPHLSLTAFRKKYGDIYRIQVGSVPIVVLNGFNVIKEALVDHGDMFSGRPDLFTFKLASEGASMAFNGFSPKWKVHRRLTERALKMSASETGFMENVNKEANILAENLLRTTEKQASDPVHHITWSVAHVMYSLCFGNSRTSPDFNCTINNTLRLIHCHKLGNIINFFPWARVILRSVYTELLEICGNIIKTTKEQEQLHLDSYKDGVVRDALDVLIRISNEGPCSLDRSQILHTVQEFIGAGMDIVYLSLTWCVLFLSTNPELRQEIVNEIDLVLGPDQKPTERDLKDMPLTHAFILETLRYSSVVPLALPHSAVKDTVLRGYKIPAGTFVLVNLHSAHHDPDVWGDPDVFRPQRFLDSTGALNESATRYFCAFGLGRRKCVGENISKSQLFIYLSVLLQKCTFVDTEHPQVHACSNSGILARPDPYVIQLKART